MKAMAVYEVGVDIVGDVAVVVRLGESDSSSDDDRSYSTGGGGGGGGSGLGSPRGSRSARRSGVNEESLVLCRYVTSTGFITEGTHEVDLEMVAIPDPSDTQFFDDSQFKLSLIIVAATGDTDNPPPSSLRPGGPPLPGAAAAADDMSVVVCRSEDAQVPGVKEIVASHSVAPDPQLLQKLESNFPTVLECGLKLALQLGGNNLRSAIKILDEQRIQIQLDANRGAENDSTMDKVKNLPLGSIIASNQRDRDNSQALNSERQRLVDILNQ